MPASVRQTPSRWREGRHHCPPRCSFATLHSLPAAEPHGLAETAPVKHSVSSRDLLVGFASGLLLLACSGRPEAPALSWRSCGEPGFPAWARCATLAVAADPTHSRSDEILLRIARLPSRSPQPAPDAVFLLAGGPGDSAVTAVPGFADSPILDRRDLVFVDVRGTGGSQALDCEAATDSPRDPLGDFLVPEEVEGCRQTLARRTDLRLYTTAHVIHDLELVRRALGYRKVDLYAISYGTRIAQLYALRHPESVRGLVLHGPVPIDSTYPFSLSGDTERAFILVAAACAAEPACGASFPDLRRRLDAVLAALARQSVEIELGGATLEITRDGFAQLVRYLLYSPRRAAYLPLVVQRAHEGDFLPAATMTQEAAGLLSSIAMGFYLAVTCSEDLPRLGSPQAGESEGFFGDWRAERHRQACTSWPTAPAQPLPVSEPSRIPTLVLVGELDPATPPSWGEAVHRAFPAGHLVVVPGGAHSFAGLAGGDCIEGLVARFLESPGEAELPIAVCLRSLRPPSFVLEWSQGSVP